MEQFHASSIARGRSTKNRSDTAEHGLKNFHAHRNMVSAETFSDHLSKRLSGVMGAIAKTLSVQNSADVREDRVAVNPAWTRGSYLIVAVAHVS